MRYYEMRDLAAAPRFANPDCDLGNPAAVSLRPTAADLTVLDAPDRRLLSAGVVFAHRFVDGESQWLVTAPAWAPKMPDRYTEDMAGGQIPDSIMFLLAPLLRGAEVGPVGTARRTRHTFMVRTTGRIPLATIVDDRYTVGRDGEILTQYRELSLDTGEMTKAQKAWVDQVLTNAQAVRVPRPMPLARRLRVLAEDPAETHPETEPAATGPAETARAEGAGHEGEGTLAALVGQYVTGSARQVLRTDLDYRTGRTRKVQPLVRALRGFAQDLGVLTPVLVPGALEELLADVAWAAKELNGVFGEELRALLTSPRYVGIFEETEALQDPPLAEGLGAGTAGAEVAALVEEGVNRVLAAGAEAAEAIDDSGWARAAEAAVHLAALTEVAALVVPKAARRVRRRTRQILDTLTACDSVELQALRQELTRAGVQEAFALGRRYAHAAEAVAGAREEFVAGWPKDARRLRGSADELRTRLGVLTPAHEETAERQDGDDGERGSGQEA